MGWIRHIREQGPIHRIFAGVPDVSVSSETTFTIAYRGKPIATLYPRSKRAELHWDEREPPGLDLRPLFDYLHKNGYVTDPQ